MAGFEVRPATMADIDDILDVFEEVVAEGRWLGTEAPVDRVERSQRWRAAVDEPAQTMLVAVEDGRVLGHLGMEVAPYGVASSAWP